MIFSENPVFVQVSGGRTSGYMAYLLRNEPDHFFMFQNTGRERPETYDFLNRMDKEWGLNLIWLEYQNAMLCKQRPQSVRWLIEQETKMGHTFNESFSFKEMSKHVKRLPDSAFKDEEHFCMETNGSCGV